MALFPTLLAIAIGVGLGLHWGGQVSNLPSWRPPLGLALVGGVVVLLLSDLLPVGGGFMTLVRIGALVAILTFAVVNLRVGGMVLVVVGIGLNLLVTVLNWGMPVSGSALVSAGIVGEDQLDEVVLHGGRTLADGAALGFLGDVIALPWGHVVSVGDLILLVGVALVTASVTRRYEVGGGSSGRRSSGRRSSGASRRSGPTDYRVALDALGRGPAPRRGPGLHPSRLPRDRSVRARRQPGSPPR